MDEIGPLHRDKKTSGRGRKTTSLPDFLIARIEEMYKQGTSLRRISAELHLGFGIVRRHIIESAVPMRDTYEAPKVFSDEELERRRTFMSQMRSDGTARTRKGFTLSEDHKTKLRDAWTPERRERNGQAFRGENHPRWKGGVQRKNEYLTVLHPETGAYIYEHRLVMGLYLGRELERHEYVHHVNGDKHDNRLENLMLVDAQSHKGVVMCPCCGFEFAIL